MIRLETGFLVVGRIDKCLLMIEQIWEVEHHLFIRAC
jgi:hypothetical protein